MKSPVLTNDKTENKIYKEDFVMFDLTPFERNNRNFAAYDPFKEMEDFEKRFFGKALPAFKTDIKETDNAYILEADLPGFAKEEIRAEIKDGILTVYAEHKESKEEKGEKDRYIKRERSYGSYARSFDISGIKVDQITAAYKDGVLTLNLPKEEEKAESVRQLEIH